MFSKIHNKNLFKIFLGFIFYFSFLVNSVYAENNNYHGHLDTDDRNDEKTIELSCKTKKGKDISFYTKSDKNGNFNFNIKNGDDEDRECDKNKHIKIKVHHDKCEHEWDSDFSNEKQYSFRCDEKEVSPTPTLLPPVEVPEFGIGQIVFTLVSSPLAYLFMKRNNS